MERFKKLKKEKSGKISPKNKQPVLTTDVKSFKENIKIKEILRTVKMNSSMRLKAPSGSKVMNNKDFNDDDCFKESSSTSEIFSATNQDVVVSREEQTEIDSDNDSRESIQESNNGNEMYVTAEQNEDTNACDNSTLDTFCMEQSTGSSQNNCDSSQSDMVQNNTSIIPNGNTKENTRDRKLSLDPTILSRREGLSQSELDLHSIGKSPLERKSSFFRKTMDSFVKNTTEMFRKQNKSLQRHVSMSVSLQSLNDTSLMSNDFRGVPIQQVHDSSDDCRIELQTQSQIARSNSSLSSMVQCQCSEQSLVDSCVGSQPSLHTLSGSTCTEDLHYCSVHSLNEAYLKEAMLNSRAISMSSGLDSPFGRPRRKSSRSNRVTWVASEGLTNYFKRIIQDERTRQMQNSQSQQSSQFSSIPENQHSNRKPDSKGRRLSYQRAVSGEDPVTPARYTDSTLRRKHQIPEISENHIELANYLADFNRNGVPQLKGFEPIKVLDEAFDCMTWTSNQENSEEYFDATSLPVREQERQAVIRELINTEAEHIKHLTSMVEVFIAAAHYLQSNHKLLNINTEKLFSNIPDLLNANIKFWVIVLLPMIKDAIENKKPFNTALMYEGFKKFSEILYPYEKFLVDQNILLEYYRCKQNDPEFSLFLSWCYNQKKCNRLQLTDYLVKPMQRLTKYSLILKRVIEYTDAGGERSALMNMEVIATSYVSKVNLSVRKSEEIELINKLQSSIEPYECDLKDEELDHQFKSWYNLNLKAPMLYCRAYHRRCLIYEANLRYRDGTKEIEARVILLTDMLLICKWITRGARSCKLIRPKYMIDKLVQIPKVSKHKNEVAQLAFIVVDDFGSASTSFILTESPKDPNPEKSLRTFENKVREAKLTYEMMIWKGKNPTKEINNVELQQMVDSLQIRASSIAEQSNIERGALDRVTTMTHETDVIPKFDASQFSAEIMSKVIIGVSTRQPGPGGNVGVYYRSIPTSSPQSQMQLLRHPSSRSHSDEEQLEPSTSGLRKRTSSLEPLTIPPSTWDDAAPSITVQPSDDDREEPAMAQEQPTTTVLVRSPSPSRSTDSGQDQTLRVRVPSHNHVSTLIYSIPDVIVEPSTPKTNSSPTQPTASQKLYQSHQQELQRNRLDVSQAQQHLSPEDRGTSFPPTTTARGSLRRGFAFSKITPPLTKMQRVRSPSPVQTDDAPSTSQQPMADRGESPSTEKSDKKSSIIGRLRLGPTLDPKR